jgi:hypothetical protein
MTGTSDEKAQHTNDRDACPEPSVQPGIASMQRLTRFLLMLSLAVALVACVLGYLLLQQPTISSRLPADTESGHDLDIPSAANTYPEAPPVAPPETTAAVSTDPLPVAGFMMTEQDHAACIEPSQHEVIVQPGATVYRWTDDNGRTVFGDHPPTGSAASTVTLNATSRLDYFDIDFINRGAGSITFIQDQLQANVTATYETLAALVGQQRLRKVDLQVVIFPDRPAYLEYAQAITGSDMTATSGFYTSATNEAVTYLQATEAATLEVARHEATHVIIRGMLGDPPSWLNEGLAEYFSMLTVAGTFHQVGIQQQRLAEAREAIASGYPSTLASFLTMRRQQWNNENVSRHYAIAWSLVFFLMSSEQGRQVFSMLLETFADSYCTRLSGRQVLADNWPGSISALQQEFFTWINNAADKRAHVF